MSDLRDNLSEINTGEKTSQKEEISTLLQPLQSSCASNNTPEDNDLATVSRSQQDDSKTNTIVFTNSPLNDLSTECQSLSVNSDSGEDQNNTPASPKKKNARKKEKLKRLKIPVPNMEPQMTQHGLVQATNTTTPTAHTTVHDIFLTQISPLYVNTSSRYLENLCHHPQFQYTTNAQQLMRETLQNALHASSVPVTPIIYQGQKPHYGVNVPISPLVQSEPNTPRYIENALKHPLLSHSISLHQNESLKHVQNHFKHFGESVVNNSQKTRQNNNKKKENGDNKFDPYISKDDFEAGLRNNTLLEGVLRINPKQFQHSYVSSTNDRSEQDVLIEGVRNRNRALEGDVVAVQLIDSDGESTNDENKQKKGKVVYIKDKVHIRTCIGTLKLMADKNRQKALFVPRDHRIPRLNIPFTSWPDNFYKDSKRYENTLFSARILDWTDVRFAMGIIVSNIGQLGDMVSETKAILAQNGLDVTPYGPEVREFFPSLDYTIPEEEINLREDCRKLCVFSIDPYNCRDIDDAVSCRELENGNYEVGVHISDVAHFLKGGTILDRKVALRATTIYLVEKAYHMLPDELCILCSLFPGTDKLAFSVFWEITKNVEVLSHRFAKTVIHSCGQLTYEHAQAILEDRKDAEDILPEIYNGFCYRDIKKTIKILGSMSAMFRKNRFESGALKIDQPKMLFCLNPSTGLPDSFSIYLSQESHQLIEEFMLLANMTVANRLYTDHPKMAFLRCHPPPSSYMLKELAKSFQPMGIELDVTSASSLHKSLLPYVGPENTDKGKAMILNMLCAKPMTRAKYFCAGKVHHEEGYHHYALNVPLYTHFTSPIRRYADIMVHRLLAASLKYTEVPKWDVDQINWVASQCNKQKYNAKKAGELSTELYTLKYIELNAPLEMDAAVVEVREKYIDVIIVDMGLNRRIYFNNDFPGEYKCIKNECEKLTKMEITWHATKTSPRVKQIIEVFSIVKTELHKGDDVLKVETKLKRPQ